MLSNYLLRITKLINSPVEESGKHHPNQTIEVPSLVVEWSNVRSLLRWCTGEHTVARPGVSLPRMQGLNLNIRERPASPSPVTSYKVTGLYSSKMSRSWKTRKMEELFQTEAKLAQRPSAIYDPRIDLVPTLGMIGTTGKIGMGSMDWMIALYQRLFFGYV